MKPPAFQYAAPATPAEALQLMATHGDDARALAGGQSLVPMMNFRLVAPAFVIDLNRLREWRFIERRADMLVIGALARHADIEDSPLVAACCPLLAEAVALVAHRQIRNRGTIGGSLALAYPGAELPATVLTLGGTILVRSQAGERLVPAAEFFVGAMQSALRADELIAEIHLPLLPDHATAFIEVTRRHGDFALAGAAVALRLDAGGTVLAVRIGITGATPVPMRAVAAEAALVGRRADAAGFAAAAAAGAAEADVLNDPHYPAEYRRSLVAATIRRGLVLAAQRAGATHVGE